MKKKENNFKGISNKIEEEKNKENDIAFNYNLIVMII